MSSHVSSSTEEEEEEEMVKKVSTAQSDWTGGKVPLLQFLHIYTPAQHRLEFAIVQKSEFKYENTEV